MIDLNNPAGRLYEILDQAKGQPDKDDCWTIWIKVFGVTKGDRFAALARLGELSQLVERIRREISAMGVNHELYLQWVPHVASVVAANNMAQSWGDYKRFLDTGTMAHLAHCAELYKNRVGELRVDEDELLRVDQEVQALREQILHGDLPHDLRSLLLDSIRQMSYAIESYRINGAEGLRRAAEQAFGALWLYKQLNGEEEIQNHWVQIQEFIQVAYNVVSLGFFALDVYQLPETAKALLEKFGG